MTRVSGFTLFLVFLAITGCVASTATAPYDNKTITTISGTVNGVETSVNPGTDEPGVHLEISSDKGAYTVHVCPEWYARKQNIRFSSGDTLEVSGATFKRKGRNNIYAARIVDKTGRVIELRDIDTGEPLWGGRNRDDDSSMGLMEKEMKEKHQKGDGTIGGGKGYDGPKKRRNQ